jgi:hypothetical protein
LSSNPSRSAPRANTGSFFLNRLNDFLTFLLQFERRFDPFFRPAFDASLRDPIAKLTTALINLKRPREGLRNRRRKIDSGRGETPRLNHLELYRADEVVVETRSL